MMAAESWKTPGRWLLAAALTIAPPAAAQGDGTVLAEVLCDDSGLGCRAVVGQVTLPGGFAASFALRFEGATGLDPDSFAVTTELVDPRDPQLRLRLPAGTFIPSDFPVLLRIEPAEGIPLTFRRNWTLELSTENLEFSSHAPYRLFRSPGVGRFRDITTGLGSGSFRVLAAGDDFSEFLIVADLRPSTGVIGQKLDRLETLVAASAAVLDEEVLGELEDRLAAARTAFDGGELPAAIAATRDFLAFVRQQSGDGIPDMSEPGVGRTAVAGQLLASGSTLAHSLVLGLQSAQGGMSGFSRVVEVGGQTVEVAVRFEESFDVDPAGLAFAAELLDDVHDPALLARLPPGVHVPEEFPVLLRVTPDAAREQAFSGIYEIELRTEDLAFVGDSPLRLFKAPDGGAFEDITLSLGLGSFRVLAAGDDFSEFVIASDLRPEAEIVGGKLGRLEARLDANSGALPVALRLQLQAQLAQVAQSIEQGRPREAIGRVDQLVATVRRHSGEDIPALWRSDEALANVAGELLSVAETLRFSLTLAGQPAVDPADVNRDGQVDVGDVLHLIDRVFGEQ